MSMADFARNSRVPHKLPLGAVVVYQDPEEKTNRARMVIVQHSRDCDGTPLYMAAEKAIAPPDMTQYKLYSRGYLAYRMHAGWFVGNVDSASFKDTGERVEVKPFDVERYPG